MSGMVTTGTVNELARHTALNRLIVTGIHWYKNVVSRGSAVHNVALLPIISARKTNASSAREPNVFRATG